MKPVVFYAAVPDRSSGLLRPEMSRVMWARQVLGSRMPPSVFLPSGPVSQLGGEGQSMLCERGTARKKRVNREQEQEVVGLRGLLGGVLIFFHSKISLLEEW